MHAQTKVTKAVKNSAKKRSASVSVAEKVKPTVSIQPSTRTKRTERRTTKTVSENKRVHVDRQTAPVPTREHERQASLELRTRSDDSVPSDIMEQAAASVPESEIDLSQPIQVDYEFDDLDSIDIGDPVMSAEYVIEIFNYMKILEEHTMPDSNYIENKQTEITWKMRTILVDWLIDVHNKFSLLPETLFLAINLLDRYLTKEHIALSKLQLLGLTCMLVASKYEEVTHPSIKNYIYMTDNGYTDEEVLKVSFILLFSTSTHILGRASYSHGFEIRNTISQPLELFASYLQG